MSLEEYRKEIDRIDGEILRLFHERMDTAAKIAQYKREKGLPILQPQREEEKLQALAKLCREDLQPYVRELYMQMFALSRRYQGEGKP